MRASGRVAREARSDATQGGARAEPLAPPRLRSDGNPGGKSSDERACHLDRQGDEVQESARLLTSGQKCALIGHPFLQGCLMRFNDILKSKRVWAVIGTIAVVVLKDRTSLSEQQILEIVALVSALVVGDSLRPVAPPDEVAK